MNVVHISTSVNASSANTRLHTALQKEGICSRILTLDCSTDETNIIEIKKGIHDRVKSRLSNRLVNMALKKYEKAESMPFSAGLAGVNLSRLEPIRNADVIHLHWICNFLSPKTIRKLLATGKPVVWTCHDSWPFTGGCHVRYGCERYQQGCGECPILHSNVRNDITRQILAGKGKYFSGQKVTLIAPSRWMGSHIEKSRLFGSCRCNVIPNAIHTLEFRELDCSLVQKALGFSKNPEKFHILFGATDVDIPYKGFRYLTAMLEALQTRHPEMAKTMVLHVAGAGGRRSDIPDGYECIFWGRIEEPAKMAALYNLADVFVYPSTDDNLPNMVMESLACATPVVAFYTGGIPDMVTHMENGYLAEYMNTLDLLAGLLWVADNNTENRLGKSGRRKIVQEFSEETVARRHVRLYRELIRQMEGADAF